VAEDLDGAPEPEPAPVPAGAPAALDEGVLGHEERVLRFQRLHRQVRRVRDVYLHGVQALGLDLDRRVVAEDEVHLKARGRAPVAYRLAGPIRAEQWTFRVP